jgi:hypothetical protein
MKISHDCLPIFDKSFARSSTWNSTLFLCAIDFFDDRQWQNFVRGFWSLGLPRILKLLIGGVFLIVH